jgi:DNA-directed RNA polymerase specialized sigma24 family protein
MDTAVKDDRALVAAMLAGDERAFTTFFETYFPRVYRFALPRMNRNADAAKDVVQSTLIKAMRAMRRRCSPGCARSAAGRSLITCAASVGTPQKWC